MNTQQENCGIKVLVVEDSRTQFEYLCHILETEGYEVIPAANGNDALEQIRQTRPTIVLTDIIMPEMDGYALCRAIKQDENTAGIPVILVTQLFDPTDLMKGLEAGADNIIIKPFEPEHVTSRIISTLQLCTRSDADQAKEVMEVSIGGEKHLIPAGQCRTPAILFSTYELAVRKNTELQEAQERLATLTEDLKQQVVDLQRTNEALQKENCEQKRVEEALVREKKKLQMMATITRDTLINQLTSLQECLDTANVIHDENPAGAWEHIIKAELLVNQTMKGLR